MYEERCPKCHAVRIKVAEYCICGHKWIKTAEEAMAEFLKETGVTLDI